MIYDGGDEKIMTGYQADRLHKCLSLFLFKTLNSEYE